MEQKKYPSPFMPNFDERNYDTVSVSEYDDEYMEKLAENSLLLKQKEVQRLFKKYGMNKFDFLDVYSYIMIVYNNNNKINEKGLPTQTTGKKL